ncbi:hypothetical protein RvY_07578 [Ramazzottius varieornatus]|uniref:Uncharacterized protein n=1 Tax=Ramazzottius varieornatus TaxID=947166 RepID=A0A1D1V2P0_RAMVA|nr:hypothetical protein RvY_07578 [Ramazzottius varieornatus]
MPIDRYSSGLTAIALGRGVKGTGLSILLTGSSFSLRVLHCNCFSHIEHAMRNQQNRRTNIFLLTETKPIFLHRLVFLSYGSMIQSPRSVRTSPTTYTLSRCLFGFSTRKTHHRILIPLSLTSLPLLSLL